MITVVAERHRRNFSEAVEKFDFEQAAKIYEFLNWRWGYGLHTLVPNAGQLKDMALRLLDGILQQDELKNGYGISSGGLKLSYYRYETGGEDYVIAFEAVMSHKYLSTESNSDPS